MFGFVSKRGVYRASFTIWSFIREMEPNKSASPSIGTSASFRFVTAYICEDGYLYNLGEVVEKGGTRWRKSS